MLTSNFQVTAVTFNEKADNIISGGIDNSVKMWDIKHGEVSKTYSIPFELNINLGCMPILCLIIHHYSVPMYTTFISRNDGYKKRLVQHSALYFRAVSQK